MCHACAQSFRAQDVRNARAARMCAQISSQEMLFICAGYGMRVGAIDSRVARVLWLSLKNISKCQIRKVSLDTARTTRTADIFLLISVCVCVSTKASRICSYFIFTDGECSPC